MGQGRDISGLIGTTPDTRFPTDHRSLIDYEVYSGTEHETEPGPTTVNI